MGKSQKDSKQIPGNSFDFMRKTLDIVNVSHLISIEWDFLLKYSLVSPSLRSFSRKMELVEQFPFAFCCVCGYRIAFLLDVWSLPTTQPFYIICLLQILQYNCIVVVCKSFFFRLLFIHNAIDSLGEWIKLRAQWINLKCPTQNEWLQFWIVSSIYNWKELSEPIDIIGSIVVLQLQQISIYWPTMMCFLVICLCFIWLSAEKKRWDSTKQLKVGSFSVSTQCKFSFCFLLNFRLFSSQTLETKVFLIHFSTIYHRTIRLWKLWICKKSNNIACNKVSLILLCSIEYSMRQAASKSSSFRNWYERRHPEDEIID